MFIANNTNKITTPTNISNTSKKARRLEKLNTSCTKIKNEEINMYIIQQLNLKSCRKKVISN